MKLFLRYPLYFCVLSILVCSQVFCKGLEQYIPQKETIEKTDNDYLQMVMKGNNQFAFDLYNALKNRTENFVISPYALTAGLCMVGEGAKKETHAEIQQALHFSLNLAPLLKTIDQYLHANSDYQRNFQLSLVNGIWLKNEKTLVPAYKFALKRNFNFALEPLNFDVLSEAYSFINRWMSDQTKGKINSIISYQDISRETQLLLTSGFYWKSEWQFPFDLKQTQRAPFISRGYSFNVDLMKQIEFISVSAQPQFMVIELPYKPFQQGGAQLSLTILLPNEDVSIETIGNALGADKWYQIMSQLKPQLLELFLPKFRLDSKLDLSEALQKVGIRSAFNSSGQFAGINEKNIFLSKVIQKAITHIDENGSDTWTARQVFKPAIEEGLTPQSIKINRPFIFVIQEMTTRLIISIGKIEQP